MVVEKIIKHFIQSKVKLSEIVSYSKLPGIYAIFFIGEKFPIENFALPKSKIIYIGKTESSQKSRDANTHFKSGKTGSSTIRKSIGALLSQSKQIVPIVRSKSDIIAGRTSHFKFDKESEEIVTKWMLENLAVSFYEYPESKEKIDLLETDIIEKLKPVLNIDHKNKDNPHKTLISGLRKKLGLIAHTDFINENKTLGKKMENIILSEPKMVCSSSVSTGKYIGIWTAYLEDLKRGLESEILQNTIQLNQELFQLAGNRNSFSFRLEYINGKVSNNIAGSAVARDLDKTLKENNVKVGSKTIKMNKQFQIIIE